MRVVSSDVAVDRANNLLQQPLRQKFKKVTANPFVICSSVSSQLLALSRAQEKPYSGINATSSTPEDYTGCTEMSSQSRSSRPAEDGPREKIKNKKTCPMTWFVGGGGDQYLGQQAATAIRRKKNCKNVKKLAEKDFAYVRTRFRLVPLPSEHVYT